MYLKGKIAVVTGATGGIGREIVKRLDDEGARLVLVSRTKSELQILIESLKGRENEYFVCDFTDSKETEEVAKLISNKYPKIDLLINCAGIGIYRQIEDLSLDDWNNSINVVTTCVFLFTKYLMPSIEKTDLSLIFTIGSGAGIIPMAGRSAYCAAKFALRGLVLSLAEEYKRIGKPKFCLITLGSTLTSFGPMSIEEKRNEMENGKAYFTIEWVGNKFLEIIKDDTRDIEYTLYPGDYGFGHWKKPQPK